MYSDAFKSRKLILQDFILLNYGNYSCRILAEKNRTEKFSCDKYRPQVQKTYTATQIGEQLGISANKVGKLANAHNLKTEKYGMYVLDKARGHDKQIENFRYYDNVIPVLKSILENEGIQVVDNQIIDFEKHFWEPEF